MDAWLVLAVAVPLAIAISNLFAASWMRKMLGESTFSRPSAALLTAGWLAAIWLASCFVWVITWFAFLWRVGDGSPYAKQPSDQVFSIGLNNFVWLVAILLVDISIAFLPPKQAKKIRST